MSTFKQKHTLCSTFTVMSTGDKQEKMGIPTIRFKSRITGEQKFVQFDVYAELLASAASPVQGAIFLNKLANAGFWVSPLPQSLTEFFHVVLYPEDSVTLMGSIKVEPLPEGARVEFISSREEAPHE